MNLGRINNLVLRLLALIIVTLTFAIFGLAQPLKSFDQDANVPGKLIVSKCFAKDISESEDHAIQPSRYRPGFVTLGFRESITRRSSARSGEPAITDLSFEDEPGLLFRRFYDPKKPEDIGPGSGWKYLFNDRISVGFNRAILTTWTGERIEFKGRNHLLDENTATMKFESEEKTGFRARSFYFVNRNMLKETAGGCENTYLKFGNEFFLSRVVWANGYQVNIIRYEDAGIAWISNG